MRSLIILACVVAACFAARPKWDQLEGYTFKQYLKDFKKSYETPEEYALREKVFAKNMVEIKRHNTDLTQLYRKGVNHLTDATDAEFKGMLGARPRAMYNTIQQLDKKNKRYVKVGNGDLPRQVDYRNSIPAVLTAVKDQGYCGSCWAHGSTEDVESMYALSTGQLYVLSQQQLTSCAPNPNDCGGTGGCGGSIVELAYDYLVSTGGQAQEWTYSYQSYWGQDFNCSKKITRAVEITGYTKLESNDQDAVMEALARVGPLAINVDASTWNLYDSGIFTGCNFAKNITIDHVVQLVGYGHDVDLNTDYWIVRNSWSPAYGEDGYIRLLRTSQPACGWDVDPGEGTGCKGGPAQLWTCGECGLLFDVLYPNV